MSPSPDRTPAPAAPEPAQPISSGPDDDLRVFTYAQVGARLGVSERTVRRMVADGELHQTFVWGRPRVTPAELRRFIAALDRPLAALRPRRTAGGKPARHLA